MLFSTIGQIYVFLWMIGAGLLTGALYALCAGLRRLLGAGFWLTLAIDALFGLGAALILIAASVIACYGQLRLYELLGVALGAVLFQLGVEPPVRRLLGALARAVKRMFRRCANFRLIKVIFK